MSGLWPGESVEKRIIIFSIVKNKDKGLKRNLTPKRD